jgi:hypothetical protein
MVLKRELFAQSAPATIESLIGALELILNKKAKIKSIRHSESS